MNARMSQKAPHILNTSSSLLGICFIVLTSLKVLNLREGTIIDEVTAGSSVLFMTSSLLSFLSMRTRFEKRSDLYEVIADGCFLAGLSAMFITTMLIALNFVG